jgi:predicted nucleic acid-binding protein
MILADISVWIDHLRVGDDKLKLMLGAGQVLVHPFVVGELALGNLHQRQTILQSLRELPQAKLAADTEVLAFIEVHALFGMGIGFVDAHLLASTRLTNTLLWTRDKRLREVATKLALAAMP